MPRLSVTLGASPIVRRLAWHVRRVGGQLDRRFFLTLAEGIVGFVVLAAILITLLEKPLTFESVFDSFNWGSQPCSASAMPPSSASPGGRIVNWPFILFGVALLGTITGALVAMVIDFMLKEGQGLGASGYRDHIVVCGWNTTARDLLNELRGDDYKLRSWSSPTRRRTRRAATPTTSGATRPTPRSSNGPGSVTRAPRWSSPPIRVTLRTCSRSS